MLIINIGVYSWYVGFDGEPDTDPDTGSDAESDDFNFAEPRHHPG
jgi:hypothetical protein